MESKNRGKTERTKAVGTSHGGTASAKAMLTPLLQALNRSPFPSDRETVATRDSDRLYPLHLAIRHGAPERVVLDLLDRYPDAVKAESLSGDTAMTLATKHRAPVAVLQALVRLSPESVGRNARGGPLVGLRQFHNAFVAAHGRHSDHAARLVSVARAETRRFEESSGHKIHLSPPRRPRLQDQMEQMEQLEHKTSESPKALLATVSALGASLGKNMAKAPSSTTAGATSPISPLSPSGQREDAVEGHP